MKMQNGRQLWSFSMPWSDITQLVDTPLDYVHNKVTGVDPSYKGTVTLRFLYHLDKQVNDSNLLVEGVTGLDVITVRIYKLPTSRARFRSSWRLDPTMPNEVHFDSGHQTAFVHYHPGGDIVKGLTLATIQNPAGLRDFLRSNKAALKFFVDGKERRSVANAYEIQSTDLTQLDLETSPSCDPCCQVQGDYTVDGSSTSNLTLDTGLTSCYLAPQTLRRRRATPADQPPGAKP